MPASGSTVTGQESFGRHESMSAQPTVPDAHRFLTLDLLRGIAAISVLLVHIGYLGGYRWLAPLGYLAVDLFFMMSGLVIGYAYERKLLDGMRWCSFMAVRIARLYPALFLGALIGLGVQVWLHGTSGIGLHSLGQFFLVPDFTSPLLFPLNGVIWSLFLELIVNAAHAAAVRRLSTSRLAIVTIACGIAWAWIAGSTGNWGGGGNWSTLAGGFARIGWSYGAGLLLYRLIVAGRLRPPAFPAIWPIGATFFLLMTPRFGAMVPRIGATLFLLFPIVVLLATHARLLPAARRLARWLAALSYPLYAVHYPLLLVAADSIGARSGAAALWALTAAAIMLFATIAAYLYEAPARKWLRSRLRQPAGV